MGREARERARERQPLRKWIGFGGGEEDFFGERVDGGEDVGKSGRYEQAKGIDIIGECGDWAYSGGASLGERVFEG